MSKIVIKQGGNRTSAPAIEEPQLDGDTMTQVTRPADVPDPQFDNTVVAKDTDLVNIQFTKLMAPPIVGKFKLADRYNVSMVKPGQTFAVPRYAGRTLCEMRVAVAVI